MENEERLAIIVRQLWDYWHEGTMLEVVDIESLLERAELTTTHEATEEDANQFEDVEIGDPILGLNKEAQDLLTKYDDDDDG